jgi:signal transduction histidine kinase
MSVHTTDSRPTSFPTADSLLAVVFMALTSIEVWVFSWGNGLGIDTRVVVSLLTLVASGSLAWRRTKPEAAFWVNAAAVIGTIAAGYPSDMYQWTNLVAVYSIGAYGKNPQRWFALPMGIGGVLFYFVRFPFEGGATLAAFVAAIWVVAWLAGRIYGARLEEMQLRHERDLSRRLAEANDARLAHEEERIRIAHELHDIIGHTVNVMVVHAGAGRRAVGDDPDAASKAFETIERTGRDALDELDRVLALLRRDEAGSDLLPTQGVGDLPGLAETFADTGLAVEVRVTGEPGSVPTSVGLAAYRIAQEALTNVLKHADAGRATVDMAIGEGRLEVRISDDGPSAPTTIQPGRGITGMKERAALHGGSLHIDRNDHKGVMVRADLTWEPGA